MLVLKERVVSGLEIKKSTTIKPTRTELLGQFLLDYDRQSTQEQNKLGASKGSKKVKQTR